MTLSDLLVGAVIAVLVGHSAYLLGASREPAPAITITANNNTIIHLDLTRSRDEHR